MRAESGTGSDTVVVRRCSLTVRGRGGWSWGTDPTRYLEAAMPAIDRALRQAIAEADLPPDVELRLADPVRLVWRPDRTLDDGARQTLVSALREAAAATSRPGPAAVTTAETTAPAADDTSGGALAEPARDAEAAGWLAALLGEWSRSGRLLAIVATWSDAVVDRWVRAVAAAAATERAVELGDDAVVTIAETLFPQQLRGPRPRGRPEDRLLVVLAALVSAAGGRPVGPETVRRAGHALGVPVHLQPPPPNGPVAGPWADSTPNIAVSRRAAAAIGHAPDGARAADRRVVVAGLPFLVLVQLARIGYLDALWGVAAASSPDPDRLGRTLVGALAGKVLPPPRRGWSREPRETDAVLQAAGMRGEMWDHAVSDLGRHADWVAVPLQSALVALYAGSLPAAGVEVSESVDGLVVGEAEGRLPIGWAADRAEVADILGQLGNPVTRSSDRFAPLAAALHERRAFPGVELAPLERPLGAAVGTALGSLAIELWGATDTDAPLLALDRLDELEVELRPGTDRDTHGEPALTIAVPRGQRWLDLRRVGLLERWPVPWARGGWELASW